MTPTFEDSRLWNAIDQWRTQSARANLALTGVLQTLSDAETLLTSGGTSPADFTLHDSAHSFRVAERMVDIIPSHTFVALSPYEKALLLLAAYCHDIGMVPGMTMVRGVHDFLLTGDTSCINADELDVLKTWLDTTGMGQPGTDKEVDVRKLRASREAAALYCRFRHNDWSEHWIRANAKLDRLYNACLEDLILVCRSHHEGYERLVSRSFDPFHVPGTGGVVHRRYLACVLRIADILDVDPERTPPIVFRHRDVAGNSEIFWWKDQTIAIQLHDDKIHLAAEPTSAIVHKAVEITAEDIEHELSVCYRVSTECPLAYDPSAPSVRLPHEWRLQPYLHKRITPKGGSYEYIEGSFRPNSEKVLQLLGSQELYTSPLTAIRELLQNAFDGVRERIALARLNDLNPECSSSDLGNRFTVYLSLIREGQYLYLVCEDDGAGMSKDILSNHFLVSGNSERPDLQVLRRRCQERGIELERTGQFGIGVLSYFLIADRVEVLTRRAVECGDDDGTTWKFVTEGVGTFGELTRSNSSRVGTSIRMRLRPSATGDKSEFARVVGSTLRETIVRSPCRFRFDTYEGHEWAANAGWTRGVAELNQLAFGWLSNEVKHGELLAEKPLAGKDDEGSRTARTKLVSALHGLSVEAVTWHTSRDIELDNVGVCRIHIPSFSIGGHPSPHLQFAKPDSHGRLLKVFDFRHGMVVCISCNDMSVLSWKGMAVNARTKHDFSFTVQDHFPNWDDAIVEVDYGASSSARLSLNREFVDVGEDESHDLSKKYHSHIRAFRAEIAEQFAPSIFGGLWHAFSPAGRIPTNTPRFWSQSPVLDDVRSSGFIEWNDVKYPSVNCVTWLKHSTLGFRGEVVSEFHKLSRYVTSSWRQLIFPWAPSGVVLLQCGGIGIAILPIWLGSNATAASREVDCFFRNGRISTFPPGWSEVAGVSPPDDAPVWNAGFPPVVAWTNEAQAWLDGHAKHELWADSTNAVRIVETATDNTSHDAAVFLDLIRHPKRWNQLAEIRPDLTNRLWDRWASHLSSVHYVDHRLKNGELQTGHHLFHRGGCVTSHDLASLPKIDSDWIVEIE